MLFNEVTPWAIQRRTLVAFGRWRTVITVRDKTLPLLNEWLTVARHLDPTVEWRIMPNRKPEPGDDPQ